MLSPRLVAVRRSVLAGWALGLAVAWGSRPLVSGLQGARLGLFVATLAVEVAALAVALLGRRALAPEDASRRTFTAVSVGLGLRVLAELRLLTLYLGIVPAFVREDATLFAVYFYGLRYLYAAADVALLVGLARTLRGLRSTGLAFHLRPRDIAVVTLLVPLPLAVHGLQAALAWGPVDAGIFTFRLIGAGVGAIVTAVCVALASAALQMGGGAWPWIWGAAAAAGIARSLAFVAAAAAPALPDAILVEQSLLWTFAGGWLLAAGLHVRMMQSAR